MAYEEAEFIASDIKKKQRTGEAAFQDCAVLYRTNAQSRMLEEQFVRSGIPYTIVGGVNFYARKEIKDLLAYLKTIDNGRDDVAVKRIINIPKRGIGATTIAKVQNYADENNLSFYDALRQAEQIPTLGKSAAKITPFVNMIQVFRSRLTVYGLEELLQDIIDTTGYMDLLQAEGEQEEAESRMENVDELLSKVVAYESEHEEATLSGFLEEVALVADIDNVDEEQDRVLLMTLHSAKGLEFSHVYLAGMEDGIFPSYMTITADDSSELEEERRLAYVGITRAKKDLTITAAKQRMVRGETQYNPISRFIKEIPEELLDNKLPVYKRSFSDYEDDSYEKSLFKQKPYSSGSLSFGQGRQEFGKPFSANTFSASGIKKTAEHGSGKPKATVKPVYVTPGSQTIARSASLRKPAVTPEKVKPFIAQTPVKPANASVQYTVGDKVRHMKFGEGVVLKMEPGPKDTKVTVNFNAYGQKVMYAAFAKLQKI